MNILTGLVSSLLPKLAPSLLRTGGQVLQKVIGGQFKDIPQTLLEGGKDVLSTASKELLGADILGGTQQTLPEWKNGPPTQESIDQAIADSKKEAIADFIAQQQRRGMQSLPNQLLQKNLFKRAQIAAPQLRPTMLEKKPVIQQIPEKLQKYYTKQRPRPKFK